MFLAAVLWLQILPGCPLEGQISSPWGLRRDPLSGRLRRHKGLDLKAPRGTSVASLWAGKVTSARSGNRGYGNSVIVESGRFRVIFAHLDQIRVKRGQTVEPGQVVGTVGDTGRATGVHLHLGIWSGRRLVDPTPFVRHCLASKGV